jgi:hypothetical protein
LLVLLRLFPNPWQLGGGVNVVFVCNSLDQVVGITDETICLYAHEKALAGWICGTEFSAGMM